MLQVGCKALRSGRVGCRGLKCNMLHGFERESCNILQHFGSFAVGSVLIQSVAQARHGSEPMQPLLKYLASAHSIYYVVTGVRPLVSIGTFQTVTGPKIDL